MQRMAKTLLFFYPAVRWLSNRLRHDRELRCDEVAAEAAGNCRTYASALEYAGRAELAANRPVLVVSFGRHKTAMPARLRQALGISSPPKRSRYWLAGVLTPAAVITLGIVAQIAVTGSDAQAVTTSKPVEEFNSAKAAIPAQNSFQGITVSIKAKKSVYEPGSIFEIVGTISTDREHTMYNAYWDPKKPVPGRLFVYDEAGNQILEFYDPRHHIGSSTGATKSACRKYKPGETQQIFLRQCLLFDRSADRPLPPGRYKVQLALNGLLLWEPREYVAYDEVPQELDRQMVAYSNVVHIEIKGEPVFQPKTLTQCIEALKHGSPKVRHSAAWTLREMKDPRAVAPLIESLKDEDHKVRYLATEALAAIGKPAVDSLIVALKEKDTQVRICAARALEWIADKRSMAPLIVALKEDQNREVRSSAARALGNIRDENAVPVLIEALRYKDIHPQITVCGALRKIGKPAIDGLIFHLKDTDKQARIRVAEALAEIADKRSTEALVGALRDENPEVRSLAARGLGRIKARSAVPALIEALKADEVPRVRSSAARALGQTKGPGAVAALTAALKDKDVSTSARFALVEIGKPAVEHLIITLKDTDLQVRLSAAKALASIVDKKSVEPLIYALRDENTEVRALAAWTLGKLEDKRAVMPLITCLNDKDLSVRKGAILSLGKIEDDRAVEPIIAILRDEMPSIRSCAARSLGMIRDKRAVEPLIPLLKDSKDSEAAYYTAWALGEIGDKRAVEPLIACLNHEPQHSSVLNKAAEALGKIKDERAVEPLMTALKFTRPSIHMPRRLDSSWTKPNDEAYLSYLIMILEDDYKAPRQYAVAWALVEIGQPAIGPLTGALQSDDKWLSGAAAIILEKIQAAPATQPGTGMQFRQGKLEKQLAWLASEADLIVVAENPWQYDRLYTRQVLKGSKVSFSNIQEIDGIEKPPTDKNKQWILFLRIEQDHNLLLSPVTPSGWFAPYSEELAQKVVAAIPLPETWGETRDGLRMGLRLRKSRFDVGEDIPVEICIQNVSKKAFTLYQHRYNNREYDYYPFTRLVVEFSDGRRLKLYKPTLVISDMDSPSPRTLLPGETYIHTVCLNKWTDWYEPAPKPGEKSELFTAGTFKITCTYSVEKNPPMVPEPAHPKNAWFGTLASSPIKFKIVPAEDTPPDMKPATKSVLRETIKDFQFDDGKRKVSWTLRVVTTADYKSRWFLRRGDQEKEEYIGSNFAAVSEIHDIKTAPNGRYLAVLSVGEGHPVLEVVDLPLLLKQKEYRVLRTIDPYPGGVGINRWDKDRLIIDSDALLTHIRQNGRVHHTLAEMPLQSYALSIESGKVEALSQDAKNPIEYFSRQLFVNYAGERDNAAMALVVLKAKSAIPALKKALAAETNPAVRDGMQKAIDELGKLPNARPNTQPADTKSDESWLIYVDAKRHFRFQYPKTWTLTTGYNPSMHYHDSFVSLNNFGKENFWLFTEWAKGQESKPISSKLPPGSVYLDIGWNDFSPGYVDDDELKIIGEMTDRVLAGVLRKSSEEIKENGQVRFRYITFSKWRRRWLIYTYLHEPVSEANRKVLDRVLRSFRFDAFPVGDELWAAHLAREHLPLQADPNLFPLRGSWGYRSVRTIKEGSDIIVTFVEENRQWEPQRLWEFRVSDAGDVVPAPGKAPVNLQTSQWGAQASGLQCRVNAPTDIEQGMPLNTTVNLRCLPENVEPGVEQLNTFLYDEFLKLRLKNVKTQRVLTVRPYSYSYIGGPSVVDTGQNTSPLDGRPLGPWEVSFPLVRERDALEPGLYECAVEYSFPKEKTRWWHWTKDWESFGFWHGTIISGSFQLKILEEIPKTKQLLVPMRLRYSNEERKVYYTKQDTLKIEVPIRNGCFIHTFVYNNTKGGYSCRGGVPVPDDINGIDNCVELAKNRKLSYTIKVVETSVPYRHLQPPGPGYPGYKILWEQTFTVSRPESNALGMGGNETDGNSGLWLLSKACLP